MSSSVCDCGRVMKTGSLRCDKCEKRHRAQDEIDESIRRQFKPEDTLPMFGEAEEKKA